jgi:predicted heme/steroid binding protein
MAVGGEQAEKAGAERVITLEELRKHDGTKLPSWVAVDGIVYDVGKSFQWIHGKHQEVHFAGNELASNLRDAPHGMGVFAKFPKVGRLQQ